MENLEGMVTICIGYVMKQFVFRRKKNSRFQRSALDN